MPSSKKARYTVTGYDRSKGGVQFGGLQKYRASMTQAVMRSRVKLEVKGVDILLTQATIVNTTNDGTNAVVLNLIPPGSGSWNRIGRKAQLQSVRLRGTAQFIGTPGSAGLTVQNWMRMVVVWDKQPSGTQPAWDTIFGITPQSGTEASTLLAPLRYDNMDRFQVLKDTVVSPNDCLPVGVAATGQTTQSIPFDCYIPLKGRETVYSGQTATQTIADISSGGLYVYFRCMYNQAVSGAVPQAQVAIDANSLARLRFLDG
jgi:hypothetical protein